MEKTKKRRRRLALLIVLVAVLIWVAGCATGQSMSMGLGAIVPTVEKGGEVIQGGTGPGTANGGGADGNQGGTITGEASGGSTDLGNETGEHAVLPVQPGDESGQAGNGNGNDNGGNIGTGHAGEEQPAKPTPPADRPGTSTEEKKLVALTFDDGPDSKYTTAILDTLKEKGVKATFFVVGQQVAKYPEVLRRIANEGHTIGNHSQNHKDLKKQDKAGILSQIDQTDQAILEVLGEVPTLFRAPYGSVSDTLKQVLKNKGRRLAGWTVDTRDWAGTSVSEMRELIIHDTKPNGIILMHSFGGKHIKNTVQMLPDVIDDLRELGYTFVTMDEIPE
ncbi:polysaccharide deacetylase family protein [Paenibacillus sp. LHD-117]|uniref:polysaccharide deacetylase family protein n=1 Tax=Paenibacillus sp. LHD-117 TaxID=3071412 RepID=UPI0027E006EF|nr:polysaccharide deacetylase family protein [Paenibacillus sp. LHD-117]MDQ6422535.1 polysaccharide deacetylase family protein [Paenibacillus sp. LHD-117]